MLHFPVYTDTGKRGRQKERFYGKYTLIIEYLSKGNNFSQVATLEQVSSYIGYLFGQYQPYMWWVLLATAGAWSIVMGVFFAIAQKNEDKEKARKMIKNYVIGLVVIFAILVACPYLVKGIAALIAG